VILTLLAQCTFFVSPCKSQGSSRHIVALLS